MIFWRLEFWEADGEPGYAELKKLLGDLYCSYVACGASQWPMQWPTFKSQLQWRWN